MKILFISIDGVLNSDQFFKRNTIDKIPNSLGGTLLVQKEPYPDGHIDPDAVAVLNEIVKATGCKIVISSTWHWHGSLEAIRQLLARKGFEFQDSIIDVTPRFNSIRGAEIGAYLATHTVWSYAILDYTADMGKQMPHLVKTDWQQGLTLIEAALAINMLNRVPANN
jgi:hypothetical protein